jgi:outer membrane protein, multidrug efflux system
MWPRPTSNCAALPRRFDAQLEITLSTIKARQDSLQLTQSLEKYGAGSLADTRQA